MAWVARRWMRPGNFADRNGEEPRAERPGGAGNLSADPAFQVKQESHDAPYLNDLDHVRLSRWFLMY
jgi:hypothetical protein